MSHLLVSFGSQLFHPKHLEKVGCKEVFMCESVDLCTYYKFHKQKIAFFLSAMRHYALELSEAGYHVTYLKLEETGKRSFISALSDHIKAKKITALSVFEIEDKFMEAEIQKLCKSLDIKLTIHRNPQFLTSRQDFAEYLASTKKPFMKTFYERQRKRWNILMQGNSPVGGKYSYDSENRKPLPKDHVVPSLDLPTRDKIDNEVINLVTTTFADHPGDLKSFWPPTSRKAAQEWAKEFFRSRINLFGEYEDAITKQSDFVYHSGLTPMMNVGLILPGDLVKLATKAYDDGAPLNSVEGYIRQVIGWREFIRGIYQNFSERQEATNFFNHQKKLTEAWYIGTTGIPPLDDAIIKAQKLGYNHHIERLMVIANMMNLSEIHPHEAHRWFMEMYIDSSDWVMGPNVYGMGLFSDGGIFATKPYTCGSNYYLKMSKEYQRGDWCDIVDGLYWRFIDKHRAFYSKNPRMNMMVKTLDKMNTEKKQRIYSAADIFLKKMTNR